MHGSVSVSVGRWCTADMLAQMHVANAQDLPEVAVSPVFRGSHFGAALGCG